MSPASSSSALVAHQTAPIIVSSSGIKQQPLPWTTTETTHLIQVYQEKWYSLNRGPLRASLWEEVAAMVAARCGYDEQSKTVTQCRHKIEKLRKRYRIEKQRPGPSLWEFFEAMDSMERGPFPISSLALPVTKLPNRKVEAEDYSDDSDEHAEANKNQSLRSRSINHLVRDPSGVKRKLSNSRYPFLGRHGKMSKAEEEEDACEKGGNRGSISELAAEMRAFSEKLVKMETRKMEMMRETQKCRMDMEKKRLQMIAESQKMIVETISRTLGSYKS